MEVSYWEQRNSRKVKAPHTIGPSMCPAAVSPPVSGSRQPNETLDPKQPDKGRQGIHCKRVPVLKGT